MTNLPQFRSFQRQSLPPNIRLILTKLNRKNRTQLNKPKQLIVIKLHRLLSLTTLGQEIHWLIPQLPF